MKWLTAFLVLAFFLNEIMIFAIFRAARHNRGIAERDPREEQRL